MRILNSPVLILLATLMSCGSGGPLTPVESFNAIKSAVEKNDSDAIANCLSGSSLDKISRLNLIIRDMRSDQLSLLSARYGYSPEKLKNLKPADAAALYFFSDAAGVELNRYFKESIVSVDLQGSRAFVKTESGIILDFVREGPYWKFDLSGL